MHSSVQRSSARCMGVLSEKPRHRELTISLSEVSQWRPDWRGPRTRKSFVVFRHDGAGRERSPLGLLQHEVQPAKRYTVRCTKARAAAETKDTRRTRPRWKGGLNHFIAGRWEIGRFRNWRRVNYHGLSLPPTIDLCQSAIDKRRWREVTEKEPVMHSPRHSSAFTSAATRRSPHSVTSGGRLLRS